MSNQDEAFEFAVSFLKYNFEGFTELSDIKKTQAGLFIPKSFGVQIGGYHNEKRYSTDFMIVRCPDEEHIIFPIQKVFDKAKGTKQISLF